MRRAPPILLRALHARSGTNYVKSLLTLHPKIASSPVREDFLFLNAHQLSAYADELNAKWQSARWWPAEDGADRFSADQIAAALGRGLLDLTRDDAVAADETVRPLLKTPLLLDFVDGLRLFPDAQILVLLRDPRSIIASAVDGARTGCDTEEAVAGRWTASARLLRDVLKAQPEWLAEGVVKVARYEDIVAKPMDALRDIFAWLGLSAPADMLAKAETAPVIGSSFLAPDENGRVNFAPVAAPPDFDPLTRFAGWPLERHRRVNRLCGPMMRHWGYTPASTDSPVGAP